MKYFTLSLLAILLSCAQLLAQNSTPMRVEVKAFVTSTGVVMLRWAPADFKTFEWGIQHGYKIYRTPLELNGAPVSAGAAMEVTMLASALKPWNQAAFQTLMSSDPTDWPDLGAGSIYGEEFTLIDPDTADILDVVNQNREEESRFSFGLYAAEQSFTVARAMGLGLADSSAQTNASYRYFVELADAPANSAKRGVTLVKTSNPPVLPAPNLSIEAGDQLATLRWDRGKLEESYNGYIVERSANGGSSYTRINSLPIVFVSDNDKELEAFYFTDSLPQNNVQYKYRVCGITSFGLNGPYSNIGTVTGHAGKLEGIDIPVTVTEVGQADMKIQWTIPSGMAAKISAIDVLRAPDIGEVFQKLNSTALSNTATQFVDEYPEPVNYYIVEATDLNGYKHRSIAMLGQPNDATPPAAPTGLSSSCDKNGKVILQWSPSVSNDVMGYRVFMSNNNNKNDMQQITTDWIRETKYEYQLNMNTLTEDVYFTVKAIDFRQNSSPLSASTKATRPDVIPPAAPVINKYVFSGKYIRFNFLPSSSSDVVRYVFERRVKSYVDWEVLGTIMPAQISQWFIDSTTFNRWHYEYRLTAYDEVNLAGSSAVLELKPYDDGLRDSITHLQYHFLNAVIDQGSQVPGTVLLTWDYPAYKDKDLMGFQLMRSVAGDPLRSLAFLPTQQAKITTLPLPDPSIYQAMFGFIDYDVKNFQKLIQQGYVASFGSTGTAIQPGPKGVGVTYTVFAKYIDGAMSPLSSVVVVW